MVIKSIVGAICVCLATASFNAKAASIRFDFEGYITYSELVEGPDIGKPIPSAPAANTLISGHYIFEAPSIDKNTSGTYGHYDNLIFLSVSVGELTYTFSEPNSHAGGHIEVDNNAGILYTRDRYGVTVYGDSNYDVFSGPNIGDFKLYNFHFSLFDWGANVDPDLMQDDSLPLLPPDLELLTDAYNFGNNATTEIVFSYDSKPIRGKLRGEVTSLSAVPIPATVWLLALGLGMHRFLGKSKQATV